MTKFELPAAVGDMVLLDLLARGPVTSVYLAVRGKLDGLNSFFALKLLDLRANATSTQVQRFLDEARLINLLSHGNICHVNDVGRAAGILYIAMEHVHGKTLLQVLERFNSLRLQCPLPIAVHLAVSLLDALDYAHRFIDPRTGRPASIVHRQLSLDNVMLSYEGQVKVLDFGAASSAMQIAETAAHDVVGDLAYMSPEQMKGGEVDARSDVFAAAVMLTELLVGVRYFTSDRGPGVRVYPSEAGHRPPGYEAIPANLRSIIDRALEPDPDKRYQRAVDFVDALRDYQIDERHRVRGSQLQELMSTLFAQEMESERKHLDVMLGRAQGLFGAMAQGAGALTQTIEVSVHLAGTGIHSDPTLLLADGDTNELSSDAMTAESTDTGSGGVPGPMVVDERVMRTASHPLPTVLGVQLPSSTDGSANGSEEVNEFGGFDEDTINSEPPIPIPVVSPSGEGTFSSDTVIEAGWRRELESTQLHGELPPTEDDSALGDPVFTTQQQKGGVPAPVVFSGDSSESGSANGGVPVVDTVPGLPVFVKKKLEEASRSPSSSEEPTLQDALGGLGMTFIPPTQAEDSDDDSGDDG